MSPALPTHGDVLAARARLGGRVLNTPVCGGRSLDALSGATLYFKCENQQRTGSFKFRGATHALLVLGDAARRGVATHSSGNHGAALALAARERGVPAHVVVPRDATAAKVAAITAYGGRIYPSGPTLAERESMLESVCAETGAAFVHPYDDARVIAGQGTAVLELVESVPELDEVWVPVGGGGLASGSLLALEGRPARLMGAEPELADDAFRSLETGVLEAQRPPRTIADGLRTALGSIPFEILREHGFSIERVGEAEIVRAERLVWERLKLVVEPSGAVALAGVLKRAAANPRDYRGRRVGIVLSGGNRAFPAAAGDHAVR